MKPSQSLRYNTINFSNISGCSVFLQVSNDRLRVSELIKTFWGQTLSKPEKVRGANQKLVGQPSHQQYRKLHPCQRPLQISARSDHSSARITKNLRGGAFRPPPARARVQTNRVITNFAKKKNNFKTVHALFRVIGQVRSKLIILSSIRFGAARESKTNTFDFGTTFICLAPLVQKVWAEE